MTKIDAIKAWNTAETLSAEALNVLTSNNLVVYGGGEYQLSRDGLFAGLREPHLCPGNRRRGK